MSAADAAWAEPSWPGPSWFAVIDCAQDERMLSLVQACRTHISLFIGDLSPALQGAAPWLVKLDRADPLLGIWEEHGRGRSWGIMCDSDLPLAELRRHFRRFLQAKLPNGMMTLFRFYDPRVFTTYIRAAQPEERQPWFNGVRRYAAEGLDGALRFYGPNEEHLTDGSLHRA